MHAPSVAHFIYFFAAPTLTYQAAYPRVRRSAARALGCATHAPTPALAAAFCCCTLYCS